MSSVMSFPNPGTVLWALDVDLERDVFRSGAASKPNVDYLRFTDLNIAKEGRIADEEADKTMIDPGMGISLFLERQIPAGLVLYDPAKSKAVPSKSQKKIHWWSIEQKHPIPSGLMLIYDGHPPGHCTLSVLRQMPVSAFLKLVALITFNLTRIDIIVSSESQETK